MFDSLRRKSVLLWLIAVVITAAGVQESDAQQTDSLIVGRRHVAKPEIPARPENFRIGMRFAMAHFSGDVQAGSSVFTEAENPFTPGGDLFFGYRFAPFVDFAHFGLKGLVGYRRLVARHALYEFVNYMVPVSVSVYTEVFPISVFRPYASAGVSFLPYQIDIKRNLLPASEGQQITGNERDWTIGFPLRIGLVYSITRALDFEATFEKELTFSDRMDGVVSSKRDNLETVGIGFLYYFYNARTADTDGDGLSDASEDALEMNIRDRDQDGDDLLDGDEVMKHGTSPLKKDSDEDGLDDYDEIMELGTNALHYDSDNDGLTDFEEIRTYATNPLNIDSDKDGLTDFEEIQLKSNPNKRDTDGDNIADNFDACPNEPETVNLFEDDDGCPDNAGDLPETLEMGQVVILENIEFATGSARPLDPNNESILKAYKALRNTPTLRVEIGGHTDNTGNYDLNVKLSKDRAEAIRQLLIRRGIQPERVEAKGYGPDHPLSDNETDEGRSRNRRIEFKILQVQ